MHLCLSQAQRQAVDAMQICREKEPVLAVAAQDPTHEQACHLDEETKAREAAALVSTLTAGVEAS